VGAANVLRDTSCLISRNENDSVCVPGKSTSPLPKWAGAFAQSGNVMNLRVDSKCGSAVIFLMVAQNKFINCLRLNKVGMIFRTAARRYADK
jgi:hypothetical protein